MFSGFSVAETRQTLEDLKMLYIDIYEHQGINVTLMFSGFCVAQTRQTLDDIKMLHMQKKLKQFNCLNITDLPKYRFN